MALIRIISMHSYIGIALKNMALSFIILAIVVVVIILVVAVYNGLVTLKSLFAVSENYPELKASVNFLELQRELTDTEDKIQAARRFYNTNVRDLNIKVESFPANMIAGSFGFKIMELFQTANEAEREPVKVNF